MGRGGQRWVGMGKVGQGWVGVVYLAGKGREVKGREYSLGKVGWFMLARKEGRKEVA